jgi:hypothetical protein
MVVVVVTLRPGRLTIGLPKISSDIGTSLYTGKDGSGASMRAKPDTEESIDECDRVRLCLITAKVSVAACRSFGLKTSFESDLHCTVPQTLHPRAPASVKGFDKLADDVNQNVLIIDGGKPVSAGSNSDAAAVMVIVAIGFIRLS